MYCVRCGHLSADGAQFCSRCGAPLLQPSNGGGVATVTAIAEPTSTTYSHALAPWRFVVLALATLGLYEYVWLYRNWTYLRDNVDPKSHPFLKTVGMLVPFLNIVLLNRQASEIQSETHADYYAGWITVGWFVMNGLINADNRLSSLYISALGHPVGPLVSIAASTLLTLGSAFVLLPIQRALNGWWLVIQPDLPPRTRFTGGQALLLLAGALLWAFVLLVTFTAN